jgi:hypothetical protein
VSATGLGTTWERSTGSARTARTERRGWRGDRARSWVIDRGRRRREARDTANASRPPVRASVEIGWTPRGDITAGIDTRREEDGDTGRGVAIDGATRSGEAPDGEPSGVVLEGGIATAHGDMYSTLGLRSREIARASQEQGEDRS